jgi:hypothetical protein
MVPWVREVAELARAELTVEAHDTRGPGWSSPGGATLGWACPPVWCPGLGSSSGLCAAPATGGGPHRDCEQSSPRWRAAPRSKAELAGRCGDQARELVGPTRGAWGTSFAARASRPGARADRRSELLLQKLRRWRLGLAGRSDAD